MLEWVTNHIETLLSLVAFLVAGWKARKAGVLNTFLTQKVDGLAEPADKEAIKAEAVKAGVQSLLHRTVVNAGLSSSQKPAGVAKKVLQTLLPVALGAVLLGGCATNSAAYKDALVRFQTTGKAVELHLTPAADPSVQALYDAFHAAINEPVK